MRASILFDHYTYLQLLKQGSKAGSKCRCFYWQWWFGGQNINHSVSAVLGTHASVSHDNLLTAYYAPERAPTFELPLICLRGEAMQFIERLCKCTISTAGMHKSQYNLAANAMRMGLTTNLRAKETHSTNSSAC